MSRSDSNGFEKCFNGPEALIFTTLVYTNPGTTDVRDPMLEFVCKFRPPRDLRRDETITSGCYGVASVLVGVGKNVEPDRLPALLEERTDPIQF
jgi:hypothetical protein